MFGDKMSREISKIPLSNYTIWKKIGDKSINDKLVDIDNIWIQFL